jgi:hypothetical protein
MTSGFPAMMILLGYKYSVNNDLGSRNKQWLGKVPNQPTTHYILMPTLINTGLLITSFFPFL